MAIKVGILGSCVTRDAFDATNSDRLSVAAYRARTSIVSIMSNAVPISDEALSSISSQFLKACIAADFRKTALDELAKSSPDIILLDFIDERFGLFKFGRCYVSKSWDMYCSDVWKTIGSLPLDVGKAGEVGEDLTVALAHSFYQKLCEIVPAHRIFIHKALCLDEYIDKNGTIRKFEENILASNKLFNAFVDRLVDASKGIVPPENIIDVSAGMRCDESNQWGLAEYHYEPSYYTKFISSLLERHTPQAPSNFALLKNIIQRLLS